jgi:hypothetical protein
MVYGPVMASTKEDSRTAGMTDEMLACRDLGHAWPRNGINSRYEVHERSPAKRIMSVRREVVCSGCGVVRVDLYDYPSFNLITRQYVYPRGYLVDNFNQAPLQRADYRFTLFERSGIK